MNWYKDTLVVPTRGKGLYVITQLVEERVRQWAVSDGMCFLFVQHTSASLVINESYDPSARGDMETFLEKLVPANQPWIRHVLEGPDDSTSHLRAMITPVSLSIPVDGGSLSLGTWQGIYLFEHRVPPHTRRILIRCWDVCEA